MATIGIGIGIGIRFGIRFSFALRFGFGIRFGFRAGAKSSPIGKSAMNLPIEHGPWAVRVIRRAGRTTVSFRPPYLVLCIVVCIVLCIGALAPLINDVMPLWTWLTFCLATAMSIRAQFAVRSGRVRSSVSIWFIAFRSRTWPMDVSVEHFEHDWGAGAGADTGVMLSSGGEHDEWATTGRQAKVFVEELRRAISLHRGHSQPGYRDPARASK